MFSRGWLIQLDIYLFSYFAILELGTNVGKSLGTDWSMQMIYRQSNNAVQGLKSCSCHALDASLVML